MSGKTRVGEIIVLFPSELRDIARFLAEYKKCKVKKAQVSAMQKLLMKVEQSFFHLIENPDAYFTLGSEPSLFVTAGFEDTLKEWKGAFGF